MKKDDLVQALELSALAYKEEQPLCPNEELVIIDNPKTDVQCYLRKSGGVLSITFRGSSSLKDWETDLTFWTKTIPYDNASSKIRVHAGFLNAYKTPDVRGKIQSLVTPDIYSVRVFGHSYGAALAILCAVDLEYNFPKKDYEVLVFGCPRVGNRAFQKSYDKRVFKTIRIENGNDVVTKIPFASWGYRHVGVKVHIGRRRVFGRFSFKQHNAQAYYGALCRYLFLT